MLFTAVSSKLILFKITAWFFSPHSHFFNQKIHKSGQWVSLSHGKKVIANHIRQSCQGNFRNYVTQWSESTLTWKCKKKKASFFFTLGETSLYSWPQPLIICTYCSSLAGLNSLGYLGTQVKLVRLQQVSPSKLSHTSLVVTWVLSEHKCIPVLEDQ